jgi:hypothetical protein
MFLLDRLSSLFAGKSRINDRADADRTSFDIIEHDVTCLAKMQHLPSHDSFDALQAGSDR